MYHYTECGLRGIYLQNGYTIKETKYGEGVAIHNVEELHKTIGLDLVRNKSHLTGAEVRFLRIELDLSQVQLAKLIGVGESSVRNWENHRGKITKPAERMLRVMYFEHVNGNGKITELINRISELNRDVHHKEMQFKECETGWCEAA